LLYRFLIRSGLFDSWHWLETNQARAAQVYWTLTDSLNAMTQNPAQNDFRTIHRLGFMRGRIMNSPHGQRATEFYSRQLLGNALNGVQSDHLVLEMLRMLVDALESQGIHTIVFVPPHNIDRITELGLMNHDGLQLTLRAIRETVENSSGVFVDLHDILPDESFRDAMDHLASEAPVAGASRIAEELAPYILRDAQRALGVQN
jgi:hypothetical protein